MTKNKDWEEQFDKQFHTPTITGSMEGWTLTPKEIKDFIASQIEKTRREAYEKGVRDSVDGSELGISNLAINKLLGEGFKAGLARAIELVPERYDDIHVNKLIELKEAQGHFEAGYNAFHTTMLENLKKEMGKW